jgi:branched-chain amino acid aminotransferase
VTEIDRRGVGGGSVGPVTKKLQKLFFDIIRGRNAKYESWVHPVPIAEPAKAKA